MKSIIVTILAAVMCGLVCAQPAAGAKAQKPRRNADAGTQVTEAIVRLVQNPAMAEKLGLSSEQSDKLASVNNNGKEVLAENQKKMRVAMEKQKNLLKAIPIDEAAVMASVDEVFELRKAMAKVQMKKVIAVRTILTPEQLKKARGIMKEIRGRKDGGRKSSGVKSNEKSASERADG